MSQEKEIIKKKIIYRSSHRGTKEMDILMVSFVNSILDQLNTDELKNLNKFVSLDDEVLIRLKKGIKTNDAVDIKLNKLLKLFKNFNQ